MTRRVRQPVICETGRHSAWLSGNVRAVYKALDGSGVPNMYDRRRQCPTVPIKRLDDVLARLDVDGVIVVMAVAA